MTAPASDIICAPATSGGGAISIVRVSGPGCLEAVDSVVRLRRGNCVSAPGFSLRFGLVPELDEVLVSVFRAPHSYTGEDMAEISCHASPYVVRVLLERLYAAGCRLAGPGEFTRRAFVAGKMDLAQAEAVADMIAADSEAAHRLAFTQMRGTYSLKLKDLRRRLVEISALLELELDFSEEEVEFADRGHLEALVREALAETLRLADSFRLGNAFKRGIPVAIVGAVNSGKSTLLNALLGEARALVSDIPGTTRDTVEELLVLGEVQYRFIDTAGLRETSETVERMGIERSLSQMEQASVVLVLLDGTAPLEQLQEVVDAVKAKVSGSARVIWLRSKADLWGDSGEGAFCERFSGDSGTGTSGEGAFCTRLGIPEAIAISAHSGKGLDALREAICADDANLLKSSDALLVTNQRHHEALHRAASDLQRVLDGLAGGLSSELVAEDLRSGISSLGEIFGEVLPDDILGEVFSRFCIGK